MSRVESRVRSRVRVIELTVVVCLVEAALRVEDEAVVTETPAFEAADAHALSGAVGTSVRADQGPVIFGAIVVLHHAVHHDLKIGKSGHEGLGACGDGGASDGWSAVVDGERAVWGEEGGDAGRVLAAPRGGVAGGKVVQVLHGVLQVNGRVTYR